MIHRGKGPSIYRSTSLNVPYQFVPVQMGRFLGGVHIPNQKSGLTVTEYGSSAAYDGREYFEAEQSKRSYLEDARWPPEGDSNRSSSQPRSIGT